MSRKFAAAIEVVSAIFIFSSSSLLACPRICHCGYHEGAHTLDCGSQGLSDVVANIPEWTTLMDLDGNELDTLDLNFCTICIYFEELNLRYNRIQIIVATSNRTVSHEKMASFCGHATEMFPRLWSVNLRGNMLHGLPKCLLFVWPALKYLNLNENNVKAMRNLNLIGYAPQTNSLEELHLQGNRISQLLRKDLYSNAIAVRRLRVLNLSMNQIHTVESGVFTFFDHLVELDLSNNKIGFIPDYAFVTKRQALETLKLHGNYIGWISLRSFAGLSKLKALDLRNNEIGCIMPEFWSTCQYFGMGTKLDYTLPVNPSVKHFHRRFRHDFRSLRRIDIHPNPWICDCKMTEFFSVNSSSSLVTSLESITCNSPVVYHGQPVADVIRNITCDI